MFGEDVSDQWKRKKQTPEQKRAARMAKLDPANWKSAKDVYEERSAIAAKKRKRDQEEPSQNGINKDAELQNQQKTEGDNKPSKKRKTEGDNLQKSAKLFDHDTPRDPNSDKLDNPNARKRAKKRANRLEKKRLKEKRSDQTNQLENVEDQAQQPLSAGEGREKDTITHKGKSKLQQDQTVIENKTQDQANTAAGPIAIKNLSRKEETKSNKADNSASKTDAEQEESGDEEDEDDASSTAPSLSEVSDILSPALESASSSVSSIQPTASESASKPTNLSSSNALSKNQQPTGTVPASLQNDAERQAARERLQQTISQFRSQRKADQKPIRSRAELLDQRRQEEQKRKLVKKEQRRKEKEEEARKQDEEMAKRFSPGGSGSLLGSPRSPMVDYGDSGGFSFGRIAFGDGSQLDPSTMSAAESKKHKGPADPASALKAAQSKAARLSGLDEEKRKDIEEKDMWLNAKKRAHGERVRDDTSLLKRALKRQEKHKNRSEKDWDKRTEGVRASQEAKQKKRTENLQKRKDEKLARKTSGKKNNKLRRPGFEGSFRGRTSSKKK